MNRFISHIVGLVLFVGMSSSVFAGGSAKHFSDALANSAQAIAHSTIAGLKLVSGIAAIPLLAVSEIGNVSEEIGETLWEEANQPIGEPLTITDDVVTAGPSPDEAIEMETNDK